MNIKIWADFTCPFCYIGLTNLFSALEEFDDQVELEYRSYLIMPNIEYEEGRVYMDQLSDDHGFDEKTKDQSQKRVEILAKEAGLEFDFDNMKLGNSMDAHRLLQYCKTLGKCGALLMEFYQGIFEEGRLVSDHETIMEFSQNIGLDQRHVKNILENKDINLSLVFEDMTEAIQLGISGVPFFLINDKYAIVGAQPKEAFLEVLNKRKEKQA